MRFGLVMFCWGSQRRYPVWTIHDNLTTLITLETSNARAMSCYMSLFLTLETVILFIGYQVDCGRWNNHGCELLYSINLLNFGDCISECLWSFLIDVGSKTMGILQSFDEDSNGCHIIHKVASLSFHLELVDVHYKGFLFLLLDFHEARGVSMNISITKF